MINASIDRTPLTTAGRLLFALAMAAFGVQYVITGSFAGGLPPVPPWTPGAPFLAYLVGVLLIVAALCIAVEREDRLSAMFLGILFVGCVVFLQGSRIGAIISDGTARTRAFEPLALGGAAFVLAGMLRAGRLDAGWGDWVGILATAGRFIFAVSSIVFGIQHFMYAGFIATLIPSWIPAHLFWVEFTGCGFLAAGIAIGLGVLARLGASLLGLMFFLWAVLLHFPRVAAAPHNGDEWASAFVAVGMCGASWIIAAAASRSNRRRAL